MNILNEANKSSIMQPHVDYLLNSKNELYQLNNFWSKAIYVQADERYQLVYY